MCISSYMFKSYFEILMCFQIKLIVDFVHYLLRTLQFHLLTNLISYPFCSFRRIDLDPQNPIQNTLEHNAHEMSYPNTPNTDRKYSISAHPPITPRAQM